MQESLEMFKHCHLFSPYKAHTMQPDADAVSECVQSFLFFKVLPNLEIDALKKDLCTYLTRSVDTLR